MGEDEDSDFVEEDVGEWEPAGLLGHYLLRKLQPPRAAGKSEAGGEDAAVDTDELEQEHDRYDRLIKRLSWYNLKLSDFCQPMHDRYLALQGMAKSGVF